MHCTVQKIGPKTTRKSGFRGLLSKALHRYSGNVASFEVVGRLLCVNWTQFGTPRLYGTIIKRILKAAGLEDVDWIIFVQHRQTRQNTV
jgi:hypothetical protein